MYSLKMSVCSVPFSLLTSAPWRSAATTYMQNTGTAGPLIVMDVVVAAKSMPSKRTSISAAESTATPQCPTSPSARGSSESRPIRVGMSNATDSPPPPSARIILYRSLVCRALPNPANWRIVRGGRPVQRIDLDARQGREVAVLYSSRGAGVAVALLPACAALGDLVGVHPTRLLGRPSN